MARKTWRPLAQNEELTIGLTSRRTGCRAATCREKAVALEPGIGHLNAFGKMKYLSLLLLFFCSSYAEDLRFPGHGFSMVLPSRVTWVTVREIDNEQPKVSVRALKAGDDSCSVSLMIGDNATDVFELSEYARRWANGFTQSGGKIVSMNQTKLDQIPAIAYTCEVTAEGRSVTILEIVALYGRKVCVLGLMSETGSPSDSGVLKEALASVRIKK